MPHAPITRFALPALASVEETIRELRTRFELEETEDCSIERIALDSFDGRLWRAGLSLEYQRDDSESWVVWRRRGTADEASCLRVESPPRFAWDLPAGELRDRLEIILKVRALLPLARARERRRVFQRCNGGESVLVRLCGHERKIIAGPALPDQLTLLRLPGREQHADDLAQHLREEFSLQETRIDPTEEILRGAGARVGGSVPNKKVRLDPRLPAREGFRRVLTRLCTTIRAHESGVMNDVDTEFLHDFRVAARRTRSILAGARGVLEERQRAHFASEFRWLSQSTSRLRDLDVYLLEFGDFERAIAPRPAITLAPFFRALADHRGREREEVEKLLGGKRYRGLLSAWTIYLRGLARKDPEVSKPVDAERPIRVIAAQRIRERRRQVLRRGRRVEPSSPPEDLHATRKSCKKLRYLMECFADVFEPEGPRELILALKLLQDNLGIHQDCVVQIDELRRFRATLDREAADAKETGRSAKLLIKRIEKQRRTEHLRFESCFRSFESKELRRRHRELFGRHAASA